MLYQALLCLLFQSCNTAPQTGSARFTRRNNLPDVVPPALRNPFPNNVVPAAMQSKISRSILSYFPSRHRLGRDSGGTHLLKTA